MHLTLSPIVGLPGQAETQLAVAGDVLTCDGLAYDLSAVPEGGAAMPPEGEAHPFAGPIRREGGVIHAVVRVVLGASARPVQPGGAWVLAAAEGAVSIPALRIEEAGA